MAMNNQLLAVVQHIEAERGVSREIVLTAIEQAIGQAARRNRLVTELDGRPEGYVVDGKLQVGRRAMSSLPWAGRGC